MKKAVFLDRDGTINVEKHYLYKVEDFEYLPGAIPAMYLLQDAGYMLVIVSNQSGIARGYYSISDYNKLTDWLLMDFERQGIHIEKAYFCPHLPDGIVEEFRMECDCRKPKLGLFHKAVEELGIDLSQSFAIGDKLRDLEICRDSGARGYLLGKQDVPEEWNGKIALADDLLEAAEHIVGYAWRDGNGNV